jgi:hypothetical protein
MTMREKLRICRNSFSFTKNDMSKLTNHFPSNFVATVRMPNATINSHNNFCLQTYINVLYFFFKTYLKVKFTLITNVYKHLMGLTLIAFTNTSYIYKT